MGHLASQEWTRGAGLSLLDVRKLRPTCSAARPHSRWQGLPLCVLSFRMTAIMDMKTAIAQLDAAAAEGKLSPGAVDNIRLWLTEPYLAEYAAQAAEHLAAGKWKQLDDAFWTTIPFGTGGRRGKMYPIGTNAINDRTIGESARGLADYVKEQVRGKPLSCAIAYDTRHRSREFAELCAEIMAAAGFQVYFLDGYRSTPELSFAVRYKQVRLRHHHHGQPQSAGRQRAEGLLVHGRATPAAARRRVHRLRETGHVGSSGLPFAEGLAAGKIVYCQEEVDRGLRRTRC